MMNLRRSSVGTLSIAVVMAFICHNLFMHLYYWRWFHSDSAVAYIVAQQILHEGRLFPAGFIFGNDLFLLRPQFAIALVMKLGMSGYAAYATATSLMFSAAFGIVASCLMLCRPGSAVPLITTCLLFMPINMNEVDFILGQQSHLMQSSLALVAVILFYRTCRALSGRTAALMLFMTISLLAVDSIMRALLAVSAIIVVSLALLPWTRRTYFATVFCTLALAFGFFIRKLIILNVLFLGISHNTAIDTRGDAIVQKLAELWTDVHAYILSSYFLSFRDIGSSIFTIANLAIFASFTAVIVWVVSKTLTLTLKRLAAFKLYPDFHAQEKLIIGAAGLLITLTGLAAAVLTSLGPVIRHAAPGIFMIKCVVVWLVAEACTSKHGSMRKVSGWFMAALLILSSPALLPRISISYRKEEHAQHARLNYILSRLREVEAIRSSRGRIYGNFWDVYRYAVLSDTTLSPAPVRVVEGKIVSFDFLSIPERYCAVDGQPNVFLVRKTDRTMVDALSKAASRVDLTPELDAYIDGGRNLEGCQG